MNNLNPPNFSGRNQIDSQLFVNCTFDMDYLEVTKNESLRKYEENVFLLGTIFSTKQEGINKLEMISSDDDMDQDSLDGGEDSESDEESELIDELISGRVVENEMEKIKNIVQKLSQNYEGNPKEKNLIGKLQKSYADLNEHQILLDNTKKSFTEDFEKYNELNQKLKSFKTSETEGFFNEILQQTYELGILTESYKQIDNFIRIKDKPSINHDLPFEQSNNIIILPL